MFDILITNGLVVDGTKQPATKLDIGIQGDHITAIDHLNGAEAKRFIDATRLVVSPGFIDIHTHSDLTLLAEPQGMSKVHQGVTTEVSGNCGYSPFPISPERTHLLRDTLSSIFADAVDWTWTDLNGYRDVVARQGVGINIAPLVGHSAIRGTTVGFEDRPASPEEVKLMQRLAAEAMDQGAFGLSTGLTLPPSAYGDTQEIVALAETMAAYPDRFYTSHIRAWAGNHIKGVAEAIDIGRQARVPVQVSHMAVNDPLHWGEADTVITVCEAAVADGIDVTFDVYPYAASSSGFSQCIPTWAQSGGQDALLARIRDPGSRRAIRADMLKHGLFRGWPWLWDRLQVSTAHTPEVRPYEGLTMQQVAELMNVDPVDAALTLMDLDEAKLTVIFFYRTEEDMRAFLRHPLGMMGSDGLALAPGDKLGQGKPHPRSYGAHARVLGRYVRQEPVLSLEEAVYKMSGQVADRLGLRDRGRIAVGQVADVAIFDPETVIDRADFSDPHQYATGIQYVLVNGELALDGGVHTGVLAGQMLEPS